MGRILVVEDEPVVAEVLEIALRGAGRELLLRHSLADAIAVEGIDLCLTDYLLPDGTGLEVIEHHGPHAPCVLMTAHPDPEREAGRPGLEIRAVLRKPLDLFELRRVVEALLAGVSEGPPIARGRPSGGSI